MPKRSVWTGCLRTASKRLWRTASRSGMEYARRWPLSPLTVLYRTAQRESVRLHWCWRFHCGRHSRYWVRRGRRTGNKHRGGREAVNGATCGAVLNTEPVYNARRPAVLSWTNSYQLSIRHRLMKSWTPRPSSLAPPRRLYHDRRQRVGFLHVARTVPVGHETSDRSWYTEVTEVVSYGLCELIDWRLLVLSLTIVFEHRPRLIDSKVLDFSCAF